MRSPRFYPGSKADDQDSCTKQVPSGTMARVRRFFKISLGGNSLKGTYSGNTRRGNHLAHSSQQVIVTLKQEAADIIGRPLEDLIMGQNKLDAVGIPIFLHNLCCHIINCGVDYDALLTDDWCPKEARTILFDGEENSDSPIGITEEMFVATSLLRLFLSELPQPLLQRDVILSLIDLCKDNLNPEFDNEIDQLVASNIKSLLMERLPNHSFRLMEYLSAFLHQLDMTKADLCRVSSGDLCRVLGRAIAKSSCHEGPGEYGSCRAIQIIFLNYETIFNDESQSEDCISDVGGSDFELYAAEEKTERSQGEDDTNSSTTTDDEFCLPVVSPVKDLGRSVQSSEPRSSREVLEAEKDYVNSSFKKDPFRSITDLLSLPGDSSRDEGVRYSSIEPENWTSQQSGDSSCISDDSNSSSESETARDADRSDIEGTIMGQSVCPHEERRTSERFFPVHGSYKDENIVKNRRRVKRKHSKSSMTRLYPSAVEEKEIVKKEEPHKQPLDELVQPFTDLFKSSEPVTSNRGADMGAWGWKMSHTDFSHRTAPLYNRAEEENTLFGGSPEYCSKHTSLDHLSGKTDTRYITKTIGSLKKKIKRYDKSFEEKFGYKPTNSDKMKNRDVRPLLSELSKLRKELKKIKDEVMDPLLQKTLHFEQVLPGPFDTPPDTMQTLQQIETMLCEQRVGAKRPLQLSDMSVDEIKEEKTELQRALLYYEHLHGRPITKEDRNLARPLYDKYREIKRTIVRSSSRTKENILELAPILENEAMDFTLASPQHRGSLLLDDEVQEEEINLEATTVNPDPHPGMIPRVTESPRRSVNLEDLHALPAFELKDRKRMAKDDKKLLRKALKDFETQFERENGRKVQKEDRGPLEETYKEYKHAKAKVKLLEALLTKHEAPRI